MTATAKPTGKDALDEVAAEAEALEQIDKARKRQQAARDKAIAEAANLDDVSIEQIAGKAGVTRVQVYRILEQHRIDS